MRVPILRMALQRKAERASGPAHRALTLTLSRKQCGRGNRHRKATDGLFNGLLASARERTTTARRDRCWRRISRSIKRVRMTAPISNTVKLMSHTSSRFRTRSPSCKPSLQRQWVRGLALEERADERELFGDVDHDQGADLSLAHAERRIDRALFRPGRIDLTSADSRY